MAMVSAVRQAPSVPSSKKKGTARPTMEYPPPVWGDYFINLSPSFDQESKSRMLQQSEKLKKDVRGMLRNESDPLVKMSIIDALQRLGLAYHFEEEIDQVLGQIYEEQLESKELYAVALRFRLLRQQGYNITTDVFNAFTDEDGNFMETISGDVKGLLSLYEAAYLAKHGEVILDKAIKFCKHHLKAKLNHVAPEVAAQVAHALETPLHRRTRRVEARHYISIYETFDGRNDELLELAKLDFNLLQLLHQEEIQNICGWWKELGLVPKLTFARERVVEGYFWMLGVYFEPSLSRARIMATKVLTFATLLDDIYDAYGTLEELEIFTNALRRWDTEVPNLLPECLGISLIALVNTLNEFEEELAKEGLSYRADFLRKEINDLTTAYLDEAKWRSEGYIPPFEDHLNVSLVTSVYRVLTCASFIGMDEIATKEAFNWVASFPKILQASSAIGRLMNDIASYERERNQVHVASSIECYMKEHGTSFEETCVKFQEMLEDAWKDINQESLKPTPLPMPLLMTIINLARISVTFYKDGDAYTYSAEVTKDLITLLIIQSITM